MRASSTVGSGLVVGIVRLSTLVLTICGAVWIDAAAAQNAFSFTKMPATVSPTTGWVPAAAHAFPDAFTDFYNYHPSNGTIWPCRNDAGQLVCDSPAATTAYFPDGFRLVALDINRDGRQDVIAYRRDSAAEDWGPAMIWEFFEKGATGLTYVGLRILSHVPNGAWALHPGDFDADGLDDIVGYHSATKTLYFFKGLGGTGIGSQFELWATLLDSGLSFLPGDFDADGRLDLMSYNKNTGTFRLCRNVGSGFNCTAGWGAVPAGQTTGWSFVAGRFHKGSSRKDILGFRTSDSTVWVGRNTGAGLVFTKWNTLNTSSWTFISGYFARSIDHGAPESIMGIRRTDGSIFVGRPVTRPVSVSAGEDKVPGCGELLDCTASAPE